jgi:hypothetical protein
VWGAVSTLQIIMLKAEWSVGLLALFNITLVFELLIYDVCPIGL